MARTGCASAADDARTRKEVIEHSVTIDCLALVVFTAILLTVLAAAALALWGGGSDG
jgi:hypothetical protein